MNILSTFTFPRFHRQLWLLACMDSCLFPPRGTSPWEKWTFDNFAPPLKTVEDVIWAQPPKLNIQKLCLSVALKHRRQVWVCRRQDSLHLVPSKGWSLHRHNSEWWSKCGEEISNPQANYWKSVKPRKVPLPPSLWPLLGEKFGPKRTENHRSLAPSGFTDLVHGMKHKLGLSEVFW